MKQFKILLIAAVVSSLISCQTIPAPLALNDKSSGIAIALFVSERGNFRQPEKLYFVKLDKDADENSLFTRTNIIQTNFNRGNYIYMLNAEPGDYVAVGAYSGPGSATKKTTTSSGWVVTTTTTTSSSSGKREEDKSTKIVYFPKEMIKATRVTVTPGMIAFMGEYQLRTRQLKKPDAAQLHYYKVIEPDKRGKTAFRDIGLRNVVLGALSGPESVTYSQQGEVTKSARDKNSEMRFLKTAEKDLEGGGWGDRIQNQYIDLLVGKPGGSF